jgi:hypothetical protein
VFAFALLSMQLVGGIWPLVSSEELVVEELVVVAVIVKEAVVCVRRKLLKE